MRDAHMLAEIDRIVAARAVGDIGDRHMNIRSRRQSTIAARARLTLDVHRIEFAIIVTT